MLRSSPSVLPHEHTHPELPRGVGQAPAASCRVRGPGPGCWGVNGEGEGRAGRYFRAEDEGRGEIIKISPYFILTSSNEVSRPVVSWSGAARPSMRE